MLPLKTQLHYVYSFLITRMAQVVIDSHILPLKAVLFAMSLKFTHQLNMKRIVKEELEAIDKAVFNGLYGKHR